LASSVSGRGLVTRAGITTALDVGMVQLQSVLVRKLLKVKERRAINPFRDGTSANQVYVSEKTRVNTSVKTIICTIVYL
jgi:hypothetical protein